MPEYRVFYVVRDVYHIDIVADNEQDAREAVEGALNDTYALSALMDDSDHQGLEDAEIESVVELDTLS